MNGEFITWGILGTYAGAVSITAIITQFLKKLPGIRNLDTQLLSYIVALVILEASTIFANGFSWPANAWSHFVRLHFVHHYNPAQVVFTRQPRKNSFPTYSFLPDLQASVLF